MIRTAIIGLGRIASLLEDDPKREKPASHAGAINLNPRCEIVGGLDICPDRRDRFARRWDVSLVTDSVTRLLAEGRPEIVVVATHPDSHLFYLRRAAHAGVPVVVCEKPLAHTMRHAVRMARICANNPETKVIVNHERRYSRDFQLVRQFVRSRRYGRLLSVSGRLFFGRTTRHSDMFQHDGTHLVDAIHFVTDDTIRLKKRVGSMRRRTSSSYLIGTLHQTEIPTVLEIGGEREYLEFAVELSFERGRIRVGNGLFDVAESQKSPFYDGYRSLIDTHRRVPEPSGYLATMVRDAVACREERARSPVSSLRDALATMKVIRSLRALW